jgi:hypothetical protein
MCAILWWNGRVGFSFLVDPISKMLQPLCIHHVYTSSNMPGQDFTPLVSVEDTLGGEPFCFCTAGWSHSARETAKRNKSHPNTVAVDTLRAASRRWESGFQVFIQVVSLR